MSVEEVLRRRVRWLSRRGLLELDILLQGFMDQYFHELSVTELEALVRLLDSADPELFMMVYGKKLPLDPAFLPLLAKLQQVRV